MLLDSLRIDPTTAPTLPERLDSERLLVLADRHRVCGLLEHRLLAGVGEGPAWMKDILPALAARREHAANAFLDQMCALVTVERTLERLGVERAVLKGPALARLYRDETERDSGDLDILLRVPREAEAAIDALIADGWQADNGWADWSPRWRAEHMRERKDLSMQRPGGFTRLELHWRTFRAERTPGATDPFDRLVARHAGGLSFSGFADVDEAAYLLGHGTTHGWARLKWLADIVRADQALGAEGAAKARAAAFPSGHEDARVLVSRLMSEVQDAPGPIGSRRNLAPEDGRRERQRRLVGVLRDSPSPARFFQRPFRPGVRFRSARFALALSLRPRGTGFREDVPKRLLQSVSATVRRGWNAALRRRDTRASSRAVAPGKPVEKRLPIGANRVEK